MHLTIPDFLSHCFFEQVCTLHSVCLVVGGFDPGRCQVPVEKP